MDGHANGIAQLTPLGRRGSSHTLRHALLLLALMLIVAAWYLAVLPPEVPTLKVLALAGPGGVLGLAAGWASFALHRDRFGWRTGLASALAGIVVLPPVVGTVIMISATLFPNAILTMYVAGAWVALGFGGVVALTERVWESVRARRRTAGAQ